MLCLSSEKSLHLVCYQTFTSVEVYKGPVTDLIVVQDGIQSPLQILALTQPNDNENHTFLRLMSFPGIIFQSTASKLIN